MLGDSGASLHITYVNKNMNSIEECKIGAVFVNGQNMKCELKVTVNTNLHGGETFKFTEVVYVPQAFNNVLSV